MRDIRVLSLFDGISCGYVALHNLGLNVTKYTAYEIDEDAIKVSKDNWPNIEHKGDVFSAEYKEGEYDLLIGGSPCTHFTIANGGKHRETQVNSGIGWELFSQYVRALNEAKPKYFLYENNASMSDDIKNEISKYLGCKPIELDSADFSAQSRKRLYWTNIPLKEKPEPCKDTISDIMVNSTSAEVFNFDKFKASVKYSKDGNSVKWDTSGKGYYSCSSRARRNCKMNTVVACGTNKCNIWLGGTEYRHILPIEAERCQTLPDNYTSILSSRSARIKGIGNGWTVKVIEYLLSGLLDI